MPRRGEAHPTSRLTRRGAQPFGFVNGSAVTLTSFQWYLGPTGSGAPVHYHGHAFNYVAYGAKHWCAVRLPPQP